MGCSSTKEVNKNVHFEEKNSPLSSRVNTLGNSTPQKSSPKKKNYIMKQMKIQNQIFQKEIKKII